MTKPSQRAWTAIPAGVAVASIAFIPIGGGVFALLTLLLDEATRRDRALAAILMGTGGSTLALAAGGWVAGRVDAPRTTSAALGLGLLTGLFAVTLIVSGFYATLGEAMDFHSVAVALGMTEIPASDVNGLPLPAGPAGRDYEISPPELARERMLKSIAFVAAWVLAAVSASALGALAGASRRRFGR